MSSILWIFFVVLLIYALLRVEGEEPDDFYTEEMRNHVWKSAYDAAITYKACSRGEAFKIAEEALEEFDQLNGEDV